MADCIVSKQTETPTSDPSYFEAVGQRFKKLLETAPRLQHTSVVQIRNDKAANLLFVPAEEGRPSGIEAAMAYAVKYRTLTGQTPLIVDLSVGAQKTITSGIGGEKLIGISDLMASDNQQPDIIDGGRVHFLGAGQTDELNADENALRNLQRVMYSLRDTYPLAIWVGAEPATNDALLSTLDLFDGVVLGVQAEKTSVSAAKFVRDRLASNGARLLGAILCRRRFAVPKWLYGRL